MSNNFHQSTRKQSMAQSERPGHGHEQGVAPDSDDGTQAALSGVDHGDSPGFGQGEVKL
jgi:hypothetical protein